MDFHFTNLHKFSVYTNQPIKMQLMPMTLISS